MENLHVRFGERGAETTCREAGRRCAPTLLPVCSGRDHRDLDGCRKDRGRSDRTFRPEQRGGRPGAAFLSREEWRRSRQGKKVADGRCGRTIEAQPLSDQTCHIEDVVAAPVLIKPDGFRRWRTVIATFHLFPSPMQTPAAPRARPFLVRARPDRAPLRPHPTLPASDHVGGRVVAGGESR